jgi:hypothetical protein
MAVTPPQDPLARERARKRKVEQIRRRRIVLSVGLLGLIVLIVVLAVVFSGGSDTTTSTTKATGNGETTTTLEAGTYTAELTGTNAVPPVVTESTGALTLTYDPTALTLKFSLTIDGLSKPGSAAIYEGAAGSSGTAVYVLFAGPAKTETSFKGELASGTVEAGKLTGSLADGTVGDLIALIQAGNAYVSAGNASHPVDAIRGPIK